MMPKSDKISFKCHVCGNTEFIFPHQPPRDDDIIRCAGCKKALGRYFEIVAATKRPDKVDEIVKNTFGKKADWY